jgi:hypothetical protein
VCVFGAGNLLRHATSADKSFKNNRLQELLLIATPVLRHALSATSAHRGWLRNKPINIKHCSIAFMPYTLGS